MKKKLIFTILVFTCITVFSFSFCFAENMENITNGIRNTINNAENTIENAAKGAVDTSKNITGTMENTANNMTDNMFINSTTETETKTNQVDNNDKTNMAGATMNSDNGTYTAMRTSATGEDTLFGMTSTTWIWLILALVAIALIALVYFYSAQMTGKHNYHDDE